ncbi:hypothetical protein RJ639_044144 [Escallonia herrerae]|uniref:Small ribosomal subunit protein cS22 n=1 Tax=Escallonia herrerae TaxID=1293975 RepID=A0AA89B3X3_9ASTE|nr:hypothetical protein RJ639_044144 [Escallonia herrerae]
MATISSILSPNFLPAKPFTAQQPSPSKIALRTLQSNPFQVSLKFLSHVGSSHGAPTRLSAVAEDTTVSTSEAAARRLYVGNIPRTVNNDELRRIVEGHGAVEKVEVMYDKYSGRSRRFAFVTMATVEDANAAIEKLNGTVSIFCGYNTNCQGVKKSPANVFWLYQFYVRVGLIGAILLCLQQIGGRDIKVNVTEKPLSTPDLSFLQAEESQFIDSPHKVYVGNLARTVTSETLQNFFAEKGKVLSAKVSRVPGTSKSSGFGFVSFASEEDVEAAVASFNNTVYHGFYRIRCLPFYVPFGSQMV